MYARAIPQIDPSAVGIHVLWNGPHSWVYSRDGWQIFRREFHEGPGFLCRDVPSEVLPFVRAGFEWHIDPIGLLSGRTGTWPQPLVPDGGPPESCEVFTLELDNPRPHVLIRLTAGTSFAVALREGKAVAGGIELNGNTVHDLVAFGIDTVVLYARSLQQIAYCVGNLELSGGEAIAHLQLPLRELMPELTTPAEELAEARSRLLPGESLDATEFHDLADLLREMVVHSGPPRPIDLALLLRNQPDQDFDELAALDPLRAVLPHPRWRRALGFGYFDRDPGLEIGHQYQYLVFGAALSGPDFVDTIRGFHTVPSGTVLPTEVQLGGLRVRLPRPTAVEFAEAEGSTVTEFITRKGIHLSPDREPFWVGPDLDGWSGVLDFPTAISSVVLELAGPHNLRYAAGAAWSDFQGSTSPVPPGERPQLQFDPPIHQLRLRGEAFLCAVRVPGDVTGQSPIPAGLAITPVVELQDQPRPAPPLTAGLANLQTAQPVPAHDVPTGAPPPKHALGFRVRWLPAPQSGIVSWPFDLGAPPPVEAALFQVEHRAADPDPSDWTPLLDEENYLTGQRDNADPAVGVTFGCELMDLYPELGHSATGNATVSWSDVFDFEVGGTPVHRPTPEPGTFHQYRVRAVDAVGRNSETWTETGVARLEKWVPPPQPVGPDDTKADQLPRPAPTGVHARVLVRGAADLTDEERTVLGDHDNAILLRWGWHQRERGLDPYAREFRVYATRKRLDGIAAHITSVTDLGQGSYDVQLELARAVGPDVSSGLRLEAGYPFEVVQHGGGATPSATVRTLVPLTDGVFAVPETGPVLLPTRLAPTSTRPSDWGSRVEVQPITGASAYESAPLFDVLQLGADHPSDELFVGVSAADDQEYVPDQLAPLDDRRGNESPIVPVFCEGRWLGRPVVNDAPSLEPVPVIVTPEPLARPTAVTLDLTAILPGTGLDPGDIVRLERVSDDEVFRSYRADGNRIVARVLEPVAPGDDEVEVVVPNAGDHAVVVSALGGNDVRALDDRYVVFLAASHPFKARLFRAVGGEPVALPLVGDVLPNRAARWVYRARRSDSAGRLSAEGITLRGAVRVPATTAVVPPTLEGRTAGDPPNRLRVRVDGSAEVLDLLTFARVLPPTRPVDGNAELLRVASTAELSVVDRIRLRLRDGTLLTPERHPLDGPGVEGSPPSRRCVLDVPASAGERLQVWALSVTRDGIPSPLAGPWRVIMPPPALRSPTLTAVTLPGGQLRFSWTWPTAEDASDVLLERSASTGGEFVGASPRLGPDVASWDHRPRPGVWRYRLRASRLDGRSALSNVVER